MCSVPVASCPSVQFVEDHAATLRRLDAGHRLESVIDVLQRDLAVFLEKVCAAKRD